MSLLVLCPLLLPPESLLTVWVPSAGVLHLTVAPLEMAVERSLCLASNFAEWTNHGVALFPVKAKRSNSLKNALNDIMFS